MRTILLALVATITACATERTPQQDTVSVSAGDERGAMARVASKDGSQIGFTKVGNGPALVIVSGALAHRGLNGDTALVRKLTDNFSVYTYDRRGRGESGDTKPYAVDREIETLRRSSITPAGRPTSLACRLEPRWRYKRPPSWAQPRCRSSRFTTRHMVSHSVTSPRRRTV